MPTPAFMTIHGERQGLISAGAFTEASVGNIYQLGREDQIMVQALSHGIFVPKGAGAGAPDALAFGHYQGDRQVDSVDQHRLVFRGVAHQMSRRVVSHLGPRRAGAFLHPGA